MKPVLLDTGVIVALLQRESRQHDECVRAMAEVEGPLVTCEAVISESCHLLRRFRGAGEAVLANVEHGRFILPLGMSEGAAAIRAILHKYRDVPASFADACLIYLAEELETGEILTLDSDFSIYRWRRNRSFTLLIP